MGHRPAFAPLFRRAGRSDIRATCTRTQSTSFSGVEVPPVGVIFDMDGTLTRPCIDFADMRRRIYHVASKDLQQSVTSGCVLELFDHLSDEGQRQAQEIFNDIESQAIRDMTFMDGMVDLCQWLDRQGIRRALLTRNVERSVQALHEKMSVQHQHPPFQPAVARDTTDPTGNLIPPKPLPHAIHYICDEWGCDTSQVFMVGDSANDDVVAANRAGCTSVLLRAFEKDNNSGNDGDSADEERIPDLTVFSLAELHEMLLESVKNEALVADVVR